MQQELERCRLETMALCDRLLNMLEENKEDAHSFFGGEVYQAYEAAADQAKQNVRKIKSKLVNL